MRDTSLLFCCVLFTFNSYTSELPNHYDISSLNEDVKISVDGKRRITINGYNLATQFADTPDKWEIWPGFAEQPKEEPWLNLTISLVSLLNPKGWVKLTDGENDKFNTLVDLNDVHDDLPGIDGRCLILRHEQTYSKN